MLENHLRRGLPVLGPTCLLSALVVSLIQTKVPVVFGLGYLNLVTYIIHILFVDSYMRPFPEIFAFIRVCIIRPPQISVNRISCHVSFRPSFFWLPIYYACMYTCMFRTIAKKKILYENSIFVRLRFHEIYYEKKTSLRTLECLKFFS